MYKGFGVVLLLIGLAFAGCAQKNTSADVAANDWRGKVMDQAQADLNEKNLKFRFCFDPIATKAVSSNALLGSYEGQAGVVWIDRQNPHGAYLGHEPYLYVFDQDNQLALLTPHVDMWSTTPRVNMFRCPSKPDSIR